MSNIEIAQARDRLREESVSPNEVAIDVRPPVVDAPARVDETGAELKRGAFLNTIAMLASNFRGIFIFLVARTPRTGCLGNVFGCLGEYRSGQQNCGLRTR